MKQKWHFVFLIVVSRKSKASQTISLSLFGTYGNDREWFMFKTSAFHEKFGSKNQRVVIFEQNKANNRSE
jgi:hypothetical protein